MKRTVILVITISVVMWVTGYYTGVAAPWWATPDHNSSLILMVGVNFEILVNFALVRTCMVMVMHGDGDMSHYICSIIIRLAYSV